jgi:hypothetical protein
MHPTTLHTIIWAIPNINIDIGAIPDITTTDIGATRDIGTDIGVTAVAGKEGVRFLAELSAPTPRLAHGRGSPAVGGDTLPLSSAEVAP